MIHHLVLCKIRPDVAPADVDAVFAEIASMRDTIPGIASVESGPYSSPEGLNRGYTHGICMVFEDAAARDAYLPHPVHEAVKGRFLEVLDGGTDGVLAFDF